MNNLILKSRVFLSTKERGGVIVSLFRILNKLPSYLCQTPGSENGQTSKESSVCLLCPQGKSGNITGLDDLNSYSNNTEMNY